MFIEPSIIQELENIQDRAFALYCSRPIFRHKESYVAVPAPKILKLKRSTRAAE